MTRYRRALAAALGVFLAVSLLAAPAALAAESREEPVRAIVTFTPEAPAEDLVSAIEALPDAEVLWTYAITFSGAAAMTQMASVMQRLRSNPPSSIGAFPVTALTDYLTDPTGLPRSDVLAFSLTGSASVVVRPSGTEPKLKLYLSAKASTRADADAQLYALEDACRTLLQF